MYNIKKDPFWSMRTQNWDLLLPDTHHSDQIIQNTGLTRAENISVEKIWGSAEMSLCFSFIFKLYHDFVRSIFRHDPFTGDRSKAGKEVIK